MKSALYLHLATGKPTNPIRSIAPADYRIRTRCAWHQRNRAGTWRDWDPELVTTCHKAESGRGYSSVYGRMEWGAPSPTITTQFYGFGNGRFGHPEQDRALSLREGALLQGFPHNYQFVEPGQRVEFKKVGRLIGNAVPVTLATAIAKAVRIHIEGCR